MANYNRVILVGNLTKKPELKPLKDDKCVARFSIAINRKWKDGEKTTYVDIECWNKTAINVEKYLDKGSPVLVDGELELKRWETDGGEKRSKLMVVAFVVQFLESKPKQEAGQAPDEQPGHPHQRADA